MTTLVALGLFRLTTSAEATFIVVASVNHNSPVAEPIEVMFPSTFMYPHEVMPVTKGTRYSIITWFR